MTITVAAIVVAAGRGLRAGGGKPKQYRAVGNVSAVRRTLETMVGHSGIAAIQPVIHRDDAAFYAAASAGLDLLSPVFGGATRQASVRAGLEALENRHPDLVLVHDAARPFASDALIGRAIAAAIQAGAAVPVLPVVDTVKTIDPTGTITGTVDRSSLRAVQTPQAFDFGMLLSAHRKAHLAGREDFTDDAALAEWAGLTVSTFA